MLINCLAQIDQLWPNHLENLIQLKINVKLTSVILYNKPLENVRASKKTQTWVEAEKQMSFWDNAILQSPVLRNLWYETSFEESFIERHKSNDF